MNNASANTIEELAAVREENKALKSELAWYKLEVERMKRVIFGSKSERYISNQDDPSQLSLELDVEKPEEEPVEKEEITYKRDKPGKKEKSVPVRMAIPAHLPREEYIIEPEENIEGAKKIGQEETEIMEYEAGRIYVKKYIRYIYALPEEKGIITAELPSLPIPRGNAGPGLLSHLIVGKHVDHLPIHRQIEQFNRLGVELAKSTINDWFTSVYKLLIPLDSKLKRLIKSLDYLMADETPIAVLCADKPGSTHRGYFWAYYSPVLKLVNFDYREGRGREGPKGYLQQYQGALQTDGWGAYKIFEHNKNIVLLACMAHARRKFEQALNNDHQRAEYVLKKMQQLYSIERKSGYLGLSFKERKELREEEAVPILEELENWLLEEKLKVLPRSAIGEAIEYTLSLWHRLKRYVDNGKYEIDNNLIENSIRPIALGRKNYLFAGSHDGAKRLALFYSLLGSCKMNGINPFAWLNDVLTRIQDHKASQLEELLPHRWKPLK